MGIAYPPVVSPSTRCTWLYMVTHAAAPASPITVRLGCYASFFARLIIFGSRPLMAAPAVLQLLS
jgi:hypothetical protein